MQTLASFLQDRAADWEVAEFSGGSAHNAIPASAQAVLVLPAGQEGLLQEREKAERWAYLSLLTEVLFFLMR